MSHPSDGVTRINLPSPKVTLTTLDQWKVICRKRKTKKYQDLRFHYESTKKW